MAICASDGQHMPRFDYYSGVSPRMEENLNKFYLLSEELCWVVSSAFGGDPMGSGLDQAALMHSKTCKDESEYSQANGVGKKISRLNTKAANLQLSACW